MRSPLVVHCQSTILRQPHRCPFDHLAKPSQSGAGSSFARSPDHETVSEDYLPEYSTFLCTGFLEYNYRFYQ